MKVSIIVATFNSANTVKETINSILNQSFDNFEILVQDGLSSDHTLEIIKGFKDDRIHIVSESDKGIYDAMNKGLERANGDIVGILNSDDFYCSTEVLKNVVDTFLETNCQCLYGDLFYVHEQQTEKVVRKWFSGPYKLSKWKFGWMPPHPSFFVRKEVYAQYGKFNTSLKSSADYELMLRFLYKQQLKVAYLPQVLVHMRTGGQSNANLKNRLFANKEDKQAWKINNLKPFWFTTILQPLRKIIQYI